MFGTLRYQLIHTPHPGVGCCGTIAGGCLEAQEFISEGYQPTCLFLLVRLQRRMQRHRGWKTGKTKYCRYLYVLYVCFI